MRFYDGVETVLYGSLHSIFFAAYPGTSTFVEVVSLPSQAELPSVYFAFTYRFVYW